jgi:hypothetical protein
VNLQNNKKKKQVGTVQNKKKMKRKQWSPVLVARLIGVMIVTFVSAIEATQQLKDNVIKLDDTRGYGRKFDGIGGLSGGSVGFKIS